MDIIVKNVVSDGQTPIQVAAALAVSNPLFKDCEVVFARVEAEVVGFEQQLTAEVHAAMASFKKLFRLSPNATPATVVAAAKVAATPAAVAAVAASPAVAASIADPSVTVKTS